MAIEGWLLYYGGCKLPSKIIPRTYFPFSISFFFILSINLDHLLLKHFLTNRYTALELNQN